MDLFRKVVEGLTMMIILGMFFGLCLVILGLILRGVISVWSFLPI